MIDKVHRSLREYALRHDWEVKWENDFPNGSHLGLRRENYTISLTFRGPWPDPALDGKVAHCGYWRGSAFTMRPWIAVASVTAARRLIREKPIL